MRTTLLILRAGALALWTVSLILITAFGLGRAFSDASGWGIAEPILVALLLVLILAVVEWPWQRRLMRPVVSLLRLFMLVVIAGWLFWALHVGRAMRNALEPGNQVTAGASGELSPFASGVSTMAEEIGKGIDEAWLPILLLLWLGSVPGIRCLARMDGEEGAEPGGASGIRGCGPNRL